MRRIVGLVVVVLASPVLMAGCGGDDELSIVEVSEKSRHEDADPNAYIDSDVRGLTFEFEDGTTVISGSIQLPDHFRDDLPLPSGDYTVVSTTSQGDTFHVVMTTEDADMVAEGDSMVAALASAGYTMDEDPRKASSFGTDTMMFTAERDELAVVISLSSTEGESTGTLMYVGKKLAG